MSKQQFFEFARKRHQMYLDREAGLPSPWTTDPILAKFRFTNVFRELDRTTVWFRENIREPLRANPGVLLATVLFRWFNRVETGEAIFRQSIMDYVSDQPPTAWDMFLSTGDVTDIAQSVRNYCGRGPYVTGAYIIKTPDGMDKLTGVLQCVKWFASDSKVMETSTGSGMFGWQAAANTMLHHPKNPGAVSLEQVWSWIRQFSFMGDFMAYEVVSDLRHTDLLCDAPDIMTWANPGPGAQRGLNRVFRGDRDAKPDTSHDHPKPSKSEHYIGEMRALLQMSVDPEYWPEEWPDWEMREVEHTLCEFDKYERVRLGQGRPRGVYRK